MTKRRAGAARISKLDISGDWGVKLADVKSLSDISPWRLAVVLETSDQSARIGFQPGRELGGAVLKDRQTGMITLEGVQMGQGRRRTDARQDADGGFAGSKPRRRDLCRSVDCQGRHPGRGPIPVAAIAGGFRRDGGDGSLDRPRAGDGRRLLVRPEPVQPRTQAYRQPGSSFKPIVYSSALDNGYTPSTVVVDAPIEIDQGQGAGVWRPENYSAGKYYGRRRCATRCGCRSTP